MASENKIAKDKDVIVSIIVPCYNQGQYLSECLESVLNQTYSKWECIIVNDGSKDDTEEISNKWLEKDSRFKYFEKDNGGLPHTRNFGIKRANGIYILPLDADDCISSNYIDECLNSIEKYDAKLVYGKVEQFGARQGKWDLGKYSYLDLLAYNMIHCCAMYRREDWKIIGGYDESMKEGLEDWEFYIRLIKTTSKVTLLHNVNFFYRIKEHSMISSMTDLKLQDIRAYVIKKNSHIYSKSLMDYIREKRRMNILLSKPNYLIKRLAHTVINYIIKIVLLRL